MRSTTKRTISSLIICLAVLAGAGGTALAARPPTGDVTDCHNWCATDPLPLKAIATRGACRVACNEVNHAGERGATFDFSRVGEILAERYEAAVWEACKRTKIALSAEMCKQFVDYALMSSLVSERGDIRERIEDFQKISNLNDAEAKVFNLNDAEAKVFNPNDAEAAEQIKKAIRDIVNIRVDD